MPHRYLHISDLHFQDETRASTALDQLSMDVGNEMGIRTVDAIIVSGDSSDKAQPDHFAAATMFVDGVRDRLSVPRERLLVVPGNHDLDWGASRTSYRPVRREEFGDLKPISQWEESRTSSYVEVVEDAALYRKRFEHYAVFHEAVTGEAYPLDYARQVSRMELGEQLAFIGLNSAWNCDHHHRGRSSIHQDALNRALEAVRDFPAETVKIAVWHHPIKGDDQLGDLAFLQRLVVAGFHIVHHGHVHKPSYEQFTYEHAVDGRRLQVLGAGTLDSPDPSRGYPWQYSVVEVSDARVTLRSRGRTERDGAWGPDPRFRQRRGEPPTDRWTTTFSLAADDAGAMLESPDSPPVRRTGPIRQLAALQAHLRHRGLDAVGYRIAVEALIFDAGGQLLLQERGPEARDEVGKLEGVGGMARGEDLIASLEHHIAKEIGEVSVNVEELLEIRPVRFVERDAPEDWIVVSYLCRLLEGEPRIVDPAKTSALKWLSPADLHLIPDDQLSRSTSRARDLYRLKYRSRPFYSSGETSA